jgi:hypothetical protein
MPSLGTHSHWQTLAIHLDGDFYPQGHEISTTFWSYFMAFKDLRISDREFTQAQTEELRASGDVTKSGVVYKERWAKVDGCQYWLIKENRTTDAALNDAVEELRNSKQVAGPIFLSSIEG